MRYAMHESDAADGRLDADRGCALFSQRTPAVGRDRGAGRTRCSTCSTAPERPGRHELGPGTALFVARGTAWQLDGEVRAVSVLVHDAEPSSVSHAVVDLDAVETGTATAGRQFLLGVTPETGLRLGDAVHRAGATGPRAGSLPHLRRGDLRARGRRHALHRRRGGRAAGRLLRAPARAPRPLPREHRPDASCACSASSGRPARRPRPITPTAHQPSHQRRPPSAEDRTLCRRQLGRECGAWRRADHRRDRARSANCRSRCRPGSHGSRGRRAPRSCWRPRTPAV